MKLGKTKAWEHINKEEKNEWTREQRDSEKHEERRKKKEKCTWEVKAEQEERKNIVI